MYMMSPSTVPFDSVIYYSYVKRAANLKMQNFFFFFLVYNKGYVSGQSLVIKMKS